MSGWAAMDVVIKRCVAIRITGQTKLSLDIPGNPTIIHEGRSPTTVQIVVEKNEIESVRKFIEDRGLEVSVMYQEPDDYPKPDIEEMIKSLKYIECATCCFSNASGQCMINNPDMDMNELMTIKGAVKCLNDCPVYGKKSMEE